MKPNNKLVGISQKINENSNNQKPFIKSSASSRKPTIVQKPFSSNNQRSSFEQKNDQNQQLGIGDQETFKIIFEKLKQQDLQILLFSKSLKKFGGDRIRLEIDTKFECDNAVFNFIAQVQPLCQRVRYFDWILKGTFTDNGCGRSFGDMIGKMKNLYRLNLHIVSEQFGDQSASQLGSALRFQKQLHIFHIQFPQIGCKVTQEGFEKIIASIKILPNIEIFNHNFKGYKFEDCMGEKISDYNFSFADEVYRKHFPCVENDKIWDDAILNFCKNVDEKANILTQISLKVFDSRGDQFDNEGYLYELQYNLKFKVQTLFVQLLEKSISLQYLTSFKTNFIDNWWFKKTKIMLEQLKLLTEAKMKQITIIIVLQKLQELYLKDISFNLQQLSLDLHFD